MTSIPGKTIEYQPSETAMATTALRALAAKDEREEIRGPDFLAEIFLTEEQKLPLTDPRMCQWVMKNKIATGAYEFMIARTAFFDRAVLDALRQNVPQLVLLGAGYDSRPYRFKELVKDTRIFELDALPTQTYKRHVLEQAGIAKPKGLIYVSVDFNKGNLKETLFAAGFSKDLAALFIWEGVTYYLSPKVVDEILAAVGSVAAVRSSICFDYASISLEALNDEGVKKLRDHMRSSYPAEPARFGIQKGKIEEFFAERGFEILENLSWTDMEARYLTLRDGTLAGKIPGLFSIVHAAVSA